jgi:anti-anti-sigma regulatory factor
MGNDAYIEVRDNGGEVTIIGSGMLDLTNSGELHEGLKAASQTAEKVDVDLAGADFIDTQVVQDLATAAVTLLKRDKRLNVIVREEAYPLRVLEISGFRQIMDIKVEPANQPETGAEAQSSRRAWGTE